VTASTSLRPAHNNARCAAVASLAPPLHDYSAEIHLPAVDDARHLASALVHRPKIVRCPSLTLHRLRSYRFTAADCSPSAPSFLPRNGDVDVVRLLPLPSPSFSPLLGLHMETLVFLLALVAISWLSPTARSPVALQRLRSAGANASAEIATSNRPTPSQAAVPGVVRTGLPAGRSLVSSQWSSRVESFARQSQLIGIQHVVCTVGSRLTRPDSPGPCTPDTTQTGLQVRVSSSSSTVRCYRRPLSLAGAIRCEVVIDRHAGNHPMPVLYSRLVMAAADDGGLDRCDAHGYFTHHPDGRPRAVRESRQRETSRLRGWTSFFGGALGGGRTLEHLFQSDRTAD
jgi:hypothetical protein